MKASVEGRKQLAAKMKKAEKGATAGMNRGIAEVGEYVLAETIPVTPMSAGPDRGELRRSGYVDHRPGVADIGFSAPYAVFAHEMGYTVYPERAPIQHTTPGTHAKFLTGTFLRLRDSGVKHISNRTREGLRG